MRFGPVMVVGEPPDLGVLGGEALRERSEQTADEYPEAGGVRDKAGREAQKKSRPKPGESGGNGNARSFQCNLDQLTSLTSLRFKSKFRASTASMSLSSESPSIGWLSSTTPLNSLPPRYVASVKMNCV
jgi:hypothetical protein